jgi:hypothetical protein
VKISEESQALGDAIKAAISHEMDSEGEEAGNPMVTPYCFKWVFDKDSKSPKDFYKAYRYRQAQLDDEVRALIIDADPPSMSSFTQRGSPFTLRAAIEAAITPEAKEAIDLGKAFAKAEAEAEKEEGTSAAEPRRARTEEPTESQSTGRRRKKAEPAPEPMGDPCDECQAPMKLGQTKCGKCGAEYEDVEPAIRTSPTPAPKRNPIIEEDDSDLPF